MTLERIRGPSVTAAQVSSQDVSIPKIKFRPAGPISPCWRNGALRITFRVGLRPPRIPSCARDSAPAGSVAGRSRLDRRRGLQPHDQGILPVVVVVAAAVPGGLE